MDADKKRIWVRDQLVEVTDEVYIAYVKGGRKMRYFESDLKTEQIVLDEDGQVTQVIPSREDSLDRLMDDHAVQFAAPQKSVEDIVEYKMEVELLYKALAALPENDRELIYALYFQGMTERQVGQAMGITHQSVHSRKNRIIEALKKFFEKFLI